MYRFGPRSLDELIGVDPEMQALAKRALVICFDQDWTDFGVHDGLRTLAEQKEYVRTGVSRTLKSRHLPQESGFGEAVDLVPYINNKFRWEWKPIYQIAVAMKRASEEYACDIIWGAVWDRKMSELSNDMEQEIENYKARRVALGKTRHFIDGPHFQKAV